MLTTTLQSDVDQAASIHVLGGFVVVAAQQHLRMPSNAQRVLGYLAVTGTEQRRDTVATHLWPLASAERALSNLRTALWRVRQAHPWIVSSRRDWVRLDDRVAVDYAALTERARRHLAQPELEEDLLGLAPHLLEADLLPGWDEEWLLLERERHRQLRMHVLESLSARLTLRGEYARAIDIACAAIRIEPLHESAHAALISAHVAEGNRTEAIRHFRAYSQLLDDELGLTPAPELADLFNGPRTRQGQLRL